MKYTPIEGEVFHVHTWRCGHAGNEQDQEYINAAIELGAKRITFTDHVPYMGDPFDWRMRYNLLEDYIVSMQRWKKEYEGRIEILCGLECEYLPSYLDYLWELKNTDGIDLLINGQHFYEKANGEFSIFDEDKTYEFEGQFEGMVRGIEDGLFDVVAHPDRSFRASRSLKEREMACVRNFLEALAKRGEEAPYVEKNYSSMLMDSQYKAEFWRCLPDSVKVIYGMDAHCVETLVNGWNHVAELDRELDQRLDQGSSEPWWLRDLFVGTYSTVENASSPRIGIGMNVGLARLAITNNGEAALMITYPKSTVTYVGHLSEGEERVLYLKDAEGAGIGSGHAAQPSCRAEIFPMAEDNSRIRIVSPVLPPPVNFCGFHFVMEKDSIELCRNETIS